MSSTRLLPGSARRGTTPDRCPVGRSAFDRDVGLLRQFRHIEEVLRGDIVKPDMMDPPAQIRRLGHGRDVVRKIGDAQKLAITDPSSSAATR